MLQQLHIRNYAIIQDVKFNPQEHFNVITGETGAGKSILMGALSLILGERADSNVLLDEEKKCVVEAVFQVNKNEALQNIFHANDLEWEEPCIIRRELSAKGKSRAFINDSPVTLQILQTVTAQLVDLHQQFDNLSIGKMQFQMEALDVMAQAHKESHAFTHLYNEWSQTKSAYKSLTEQLSQQQKDKDYYQFLFDELEQLSFKTNEIEVLEQTIQQQTHKENILQQLSAAAHLMQEGADPVVQNVKRVLALLQSVSDHVPALPTIIERMQSTYEELKDLGNEITQQLENINRQTEPVDNLLERYDAGIRLLKKHNVTHTDELLQLQKDLQLKLHQTENSAAQLEQLAQQIDECYKQLLAAGKILHDKRAKASATFAKSVSQSIQQMGMVHAQFKIDLSSKEIPDAYGFDQVSFEMDANNSGKFLPIHKSASGGEMSRLMLAIKTLLAGKMYLPTLIFDEVDTGISGEAAKQVGYLLKQLGQQHQVISITHQPQIAAMADAHFYVFKQADNNGQSQTQISLLNKEDRVSHIAEMITGKEQTEAARSHAKELLAR